MNKALIIGPRFHYFNQSVERAFRALGFETRVLAYDNPIHPYDLGNKIRYKFSADKLQLKRQSRALFHMEAELAFEEFEPDVVFVMNGDMLLSDTLLHWRGVLEDDPAPVEKPAKVALWFFDSMTHIPLCEECVTAVDAVFCYEQTDIPLIKSRFGVDAHFLPQAVDTEIYHPLETEKEYDIVFAGDIFHSQRRRQIVQKVVAHYPQLRIRIWGEYKPWYKNPLQWLTRERKDVYMNRNASGQQLNADYNKSRIVLNIHHEQQKDGANPKVYEIAATGSYQVCDANPYLETLFSEGEVGLYHSDEEMFRLIDAALLDVEKATSAASAARLVIQREHTFECRMLDVCRVLKVAVGTQTTPFVQSQNKNILQ